MRSDTPITRRMTCSISTSVTPCSSRMRRNSRSNWATRLTSRPTAGSSNRTTLGLLMSARAISTIRCWPNDSASPGRSANASMPTNFSASRALADISASSSRMALLRNAAENNPVVPLRCSPVIMFSSTVRPGNSCEVWKVRPMPSAAMRLGFMPLMSVSSRTISPSLSLFSPEMTFSSVVLPAPLGPITPMITPGATSVLTLDSALTPPNAMDTSRMDKTVMPVARVDLAALCRRAAAPPGTGPPRRSRLPCRRAPPSRGAIASTGRRCPWA